MTKPFASDPVLSGLYPNTDEIACAIKHASDDTVNAFVRLWLTEGPPAAFKEAPAVYEDIRRWLGARLLVHPKEVTLIGSARIGCSLAPAPDFGRPFGPHSDLDLSIISFQLFSGVAESFRKFAADFDAALVSPRSSREAHLWKENLAFGKRNLPRGFFDPDKIPTYSRYPIAQQVSQSMWLLKKKLDATPHAPAIRRASVRVYKDWNSFIDRVSFNIRTVCQRQGT